MESRQSLRFDQRVQGKAVNSYEVEAYVTNRVLGSEVWSQGEKGEDIHGEADEEL